MERSLQNKFEQIAPMIGNTPLLEIRFRFHGKERRIFAKAEAYNLTGSIKDRVAHYVLKRRMKKGTSGREKLLRKQRAGIQALRFLL